MAVGYGIKPIITDGLVLHLDAGNPKSYSGSGTTWFDLSKNNNNATLTGNASNLTWDSAGHFYHNPGDGYYGAPAYDVASTTDNAAYWEISSHTSLDPSNGWTVMGVMNILGGQSHNGCGWFVQGAGELRIHLEPQNNNFRANASNGWGQINAGITSYHNVFVHYAFTFTQDSGTYGTDNGTIIMYINGSQVAQDTSFIPTSDVDYSIDLGRRNGHFRHYMYANVINYQFYNRPLTVDEINVNYDSIKGRWS